MEQKTQHELTCKKCGTISQAIVRSHAIHYAGAYCSSCDRWIQWLPRPASALSVAVSIDEQRVTVQEEIRTRERVYKHWVASGRMEQAEMDQRIAEMEAVLQTLRDRDAPRTISIHAQVKCVQDEVGKRKSIYKKWIGEGRIKPEEANKRIARMEAVLATLQEYKTEEMHGHSLFGQ